MHVTSAEFKLNWCCSFTKKIVKNFCLEESHYHYVKKFLFIGGWKMPQHIAHEMALKK